MFVEKFMNHGIAYLRLVKGVYSTNSNGKKYSKKEVVLNIGPLSRFDDGLPDYINRLKESFKLGNPLISSLKDYVEINPIRTTYTETFTDGDPKCFGETKLFANVLFERILEELGLIAFFNRYKGLTNYSFDLIGFFRLLVYGRILNPSSKIATVKQNNDYYEKIVKTDYEYNVYDTLTFINKYFSSIISKMNQNLVKSFKRTTDIIYYDVTNFFFEIQEPDDDAIDDDGNVIKTGIRKNGVCKEERNLPIVQMGLFMDEQGLPISIEMFPGNTLDHQTMKKSMEETVDNLNIGRFVFVGDRGMCNGINIATLYDRNHGYVMSKSILKSNAKDKAWILDDKDYIKEGETFKYKSKIINRKTTLKQENGTKKEYEYTEKMVAYWSKSFYDKQVKENQSFMDFIKKLKESPQNFRISKLQYKSLSKYFKKEVVNTKTGEILNSNDLKAMIDFDTIDETTKYYGYYQIVSSEVDKSEKEIIDIYHGLSRIEDQFRIMKGDLLTRPINVYTDEHIRAHLLICMIALTIIRIIQNKIVDYKNKTEPNKNDKYWSMGLTCNRIKRALNKWQVSEINMNQFRFFNIADEDLQMILKAFDIHIPYKIFTKGELKDIKMEIKIIN